MSFSAARMVPGKRKLPKVIGFTVWGPSEHETLVFTGPSVRRLAGRGYSPPNYCMLRPGRGDPMLPGKVNFPFALLGRCRS